MSKGTDTKSSILRQALDLSSEVGLEGLSVGSLAKRVGMSKSGLYAHFDSKEQLQSQVLDAAAEMFAASVVAPALRESRGLPRVQALFRGWLTWTSEELSGGCPFVGAATEFDDKPGLVRETLVGHLSNMTGFITRAAQISVEEGHLRRNLDVEQFAFEFWSIMLAYHQYSRLMRHDEARKRANRAFDALILNSQPVN